MNHSQNSMLRRLSPLAMAICLSGCFSSNESSVRTIDLTIPLGGGVEFREFSFDANSGVPEPSVVTLRTQGEWKIFWDDYMSSQAAAAGLPDIDFDRYMVVAIFAGLSMAGCGEAHVDRAGVLLDQPMLQLVYKINTRPAGTCNSYWSTPATLLVMERRDEAVTIVRASDQSLGTHALGAANKGLALNKRQRGSEGRNQAL